MTEQLVQPTITRAKPPKRRPPSQHFRKENVPDIIDIKIDDEEEVKDADEEGEVIDVVQSSTKYSPDKPMMKMLDISSVKLRSKNDRTPPKKTSSVEEDEKPKPLWMQELNQKQGNRKSIGLFLEKQETNLIKDKK